MQVYLGQDGICHATDPSRITDELREKLAEYEPQETGDAFVARQVGRTGYDAMIAMCDRIDAIHAGLERENAELRERLAKMDNRGGSMHIGEATVTVKPTLDWSAVALELHSLACHLAGEAE